MDRELYTACAGSDFTDECNAGRLVAPSAIFARYPLLTEQERADLEREFVFVVKWFYPHLLRAYHARRRAVTAPKTIPKP